MAYELSGTTDNGPLTSSSRLFGVLGGDGDPAPEMFSPTLIRDFVRALTDTLYPTQAELSSLDDYVTSFTLQKDQDAGHGQWEGQSLRATGFADGIASTDLATYGQLQQAVLNNTFSIPNLDAIASVDATADLLLIYDTSAGVNKKITPDALLIAALDPDLGEIAALTSWAGVTRASGFDTFAATPSSANLRSLLTDESGSGVAYFQGGDLGTPSAGVLTNATGLPTAGLVDDAVTFAKMQNIATDRLVGRDTASSGDPEEISVGGGLEFTGSAGIQRSALTGDVEAAAGSGTTAIANNAVTDAKLRDSAAVSVIGRSANSSGDPADIAAAANDTILRRVSDAVGFGALTVGMAAANLWTYAKLQQVSATSRILGRKTSGAGDIEECTLSEVLDFIGSAAKGDILYRNTSGWARLPIGSDNHVLKVATDVPNWEAESAGGGSPTIPQGRLTLQSGVAVMTTTQSAKTTVYYCARGAGGTGGFYVPIYDGSAWTMTDVLAELSQATTDSTKSPAACTTNSNYDLFVWDDSGTYRCTRGPAWSSDTARGTGAGTTELEAIKGLLTNKFAITNGPGANRGTYVGTIRTNGSSQVDWIYGALAAGGTAGSFGVWNMYNRVRASSLVADSTNSWTYGVAAAAWRAANSSTTMRVSYVCGLAEDIIEAAYQCVVSADSLGNGQAIGIGVDSTTTFSGTPGFYNQNPADAKVALYNAIPGLGFHFIQAIEYNNAGTGTFSGDSGAPSWIQSGLHVRGRF